MQTFELATITGRAKTFFLNKNFDSFFLFKKFLQNASCQEYGNKFAVKIKRSCHVLQNTISYKRLKSYLV